MPEQNSPFVSVIIPAYNSEAVIGEAIESILTQSYTNLECIVIDDCSSDKTWAIVQGFAMKDSRVKPYRNKKNLGIGGNRNKGIKLAAGEYICWQDADDISLPYRIETQVTYLLNHSEVGLVGGYLEFFGDKIKPSIRKYPEEDSSLKKMIFRANPIAQPAMFCKAECYKVVGAYNEKLRVDEDLDFLFRVGEQYEFANVQEVVIRYRQDEKSLTGSNLRLMERTSLQLRKAYAKSPAYSYTALDYVYNLAQFVSMFIIPAKLKIKLFNMLRNSAA